MGSSPLQYSLSGPSLEGKAHKDVVDAIDSLQKQSASIQKALTDVNSSLAALPTADQIQSQIQTLQQTLSGMSAYDLTTHGNSSGLNSQGSVLPTVNGKFAYTSTTNSITWYWDGTNGSTLLSLLLPDGSTLQIPPANVTVTGLTASTSYNFYPYFNVDLGSTSFNPTSAGIGTPAIAYLGSSAVAAIAQSLDNRIGLNGTTMSASTTASGTGGGSGGGSGGSCVREDTDIQPLSGRLFSHKMNEENWVEMHTVSGIKLVGVPEHRIFTERGLLPMDRLELGIEVVTRIGASQIQFLRSFKEKADKLKVWVPRGHLYWANGILSHNLKPL